MSERGFPENSWFIGCGAMGGAMVEGWRAHGPGIDNLSAISPSGRRIEGLTVATTMPQDEIGWCLLGHKPDQLAEVAAALPGVTASTVVISILGGVEATSLRRHFPHARAIVRAMPNLPVAVGAGVVGLYSSDADEEVRASVGAMMAHLGYAPWCADEDELVPIATVAGSGPAYVARFVAALAAEAERLGVAPAMARRLALETVGGTVALADATERDLGDIAKGVASPGGSTQEGLDVLDAPDGMRDLVHRTVEAARRRTCEMAEAARG